MDVSREIIMDYSRLKQEIKEVVDIASSVPDHFKEKCFEVLLNKLLEEKPWEAPKKIEKEPTPPLPTGIELPVSTQLRVFMKRTGVSVDEIKKVLMVADNEVHFVREPTSEKIADGQINWALLLALKNCVLNNDLSVDPEDIRSICQEKGFYDGANFAAIFKRPKYSKLFKGLMEPQGKPQALTIEGENELCDLIRSLAASKS